MYRMAVVAVVLAMLAGAAAEAWNWMHGFRGEICLGVGRPERTAVSEADGAIQIPFLTPKRDIRRAAPGSIQFDDQSTASKLPTDGVFDAVRLPFALRLKQVNVLREAQSHNLLRIVGPESERTVDLQDRAELDLNGEKFRVASVRKWSGLARFQSGQPLASLSLRRNGEPWTEDIFLAQDSWRKVEPNVGLCLSWTDSELAARQELAKGLPGIQSARWGIVDGPAIDWTKSFAPGPAADLRNGGSTTFLRLDESAALPFIEVQFLEGGKRSIEKAVANATNPDARVLFEYPSRLDSVITLVAFEDDKALCAAYEKQKSCGQKILGAGETWAPDAFPYEIRLDQALRAAAPVAEKDSTLYEAVLQGTTRELRLRQGEALRRADLMLEFSRKADAPELQYELVASDEASALSRAFSLGPGDTARVKDWRFSQGPFGADPRRDAVIEVQYSPVWSPPRIILAGSLAALACLVVFKRSEHEMASAASRTRKPVPKRKRKPKTTLQEASSGTPNDKPKRRPAKRSTKRPEKD